LPSFSCSFLNLSEYNVMSIMELEDWI
jgi:hypothetical protein